MQKRKLNAARLARWTLFILAAGLTSRASSAPPDPRAYSRFTFDLAPAFDFDRPIALERLEVFTATDAPKFVRARYRKRLNGAWVTATDELIMNFFTFEEYHRVQAAAEVQVEQLSVALGQPAPHLFMPTYARDTMMASAWSNSFAQTTRDLQLGRPARFANAEFTVAMTQHSFVHAPATFPVVVYLRHLDWDSVRGGPVRVAQQLLTGHARRETLDAADLAAVTRWRTLLSCESELN